MNWPLLVAEIVVVLLTFHFLYRTEAFTAALESCSDCSVRAHPLCFVCFGAFRNARGIGILVTRPAFGNPTC